LERIREEADIVAQTRKAGPDDRSLRDLLAAIVAGDENLVSRLLAAAPGLATDSFQTGATRQSAKQNYLAEIGRYLWKGDTALHIAATAYRTEMVRRLVNASANVQAKNRLGDAPLHSAAVGQPGAHWWNPAAQAATVAILIQAGADPNARNKTGVAPLHRAVRTRCAAAVKALLENGADPELRNKSGSTPMLLAIQNTGRGGSGSPAAKLEQEEIIRLLKSYSGVVHS
jgi:ankyrin repeat protein